MNKDKTRSMNNKGFSLVELLIAVAIAMIVGGAVFGFMRVGARTFSFNSADVNLQSESQLAFNQMQELIIDTAVGVQYFAKTGSGFDEDSSDLRKVASDAEIGSTEDKLLRLYNVEDVYDIWWDRNTGELYYNEWKADPASDSKKPINLSDASAPHNELMSEYISDFSIDLSRLTQRVVRVDFTYEKGDRVQAYSHNITLRNQIVSGNTIEERIRDAFTISANVIPDNIKGKDIIYVEPGDTVDLTAIVDDGATGLTGYHVYDAANVEIPTSGAGAKETLHYSFTTTSGHKTGYTTIGYSSGSLYVHPTETIGEFQVLVYCQSNNAIAKVVNVRVVRTTSISVDFIAEVGDNKKNELDNGATGDDMFADDLKADETFKLKATPSISWTESSTPVAEMSPSDKTKLQTIESNINSGIYFKGLTGYPNLFKTTGNLNNNPCEFKMMNNLTFGVGEAEYYTSPISVRAICGYSESKSRDVHKDWQGSAYKKKADFTITYKNNIQRGAPQYIYKTTNTFECNNHTDSQGGFWANHVQLLEVEAIERDYSNPKEDGSPTLRNMNREEYIRNFTITNGQEGNTITWKCPVEWRLDCEYEFRFTMHIAPVKNGVSATQGIYVLPYAGYEKKDFEFTSNTTPPVVFHRFSLSYKEKENYNNINIEQIAKGAPDSDDYVDEGNHVTYYARNFQEYAPRGTKRLGYYELDDELDKLQNRVEKNNYNDFPKKGETNKVYIEMSTGIKYGWDGGKYYVCEQFESKSEFPADGEAGHIYYSHVGFERIENFPFEWLASKDNFPEIGEKLSKIYVDNSNQRKYVWDGENYYECTYATKDSFPYKSKDGTILNGYIYFIPDSWEVYRITDSGAYYRFKKDWTDDPISLPIALNNEFTWRTDVWKALIESKSEKNSSGKWKIYKQTDEGKWEEYSERNIVSDYDMHDKNDDKMTFNYFVSQNDGGYLRMNLFTDCIDKKIPSRLRICPFITWVGSNYQSEDNVTYETRDYVIDQNYVECVFWNIKIPYKSILGELFKTTGWGSSYDISYFPAPDEPNFPGAKSTATRWFCAGYGDKADYITTEAADGGKFYDLRYTLTEVSNYNAPSTWKLKLMYEGSGHENKDLATYTYNPKTKQWDLTQ